jgi:predicted phosphate transport protein (TIGR00153 family)
MNLLSWFAPHEQQFFDMIEKQSQNVVKGVKKLEDMLKNYKDLDNKRKEIKRIESDGDKMVHDIHAELNKTFITPIDREDITALISSLDDILDYAEAVSERLIIYEITQPPRHMIEMAVTLRKASEDVNRAIALIRDFKNAKKIRSYIKEIHTYENRGDELLRDAMVDLFKNKDPVTIIKMKELYDNLETGIDKCEDAADVIGDILVKYA